MTKQSIPHKSIVLAVVAIFFVAGQAVLEPVSAKADSSLTGKKITVLVPFSKGSETDAFARSILPTITKYLQGEPKVSIQNIPGMDSIKGANVFQKTAKKDGATILVASVPTNMNFILRMRGVKYKLNTYKPILLSQNPVTVYSRWTIKDMKGLRAVYAGSRSSSSDLHSMLMIELLGVHLKTIWGAKLRELDLPQGKKIIHADSKGIHINQTGKKSKLRPVWTSGRLQTDGTVGRDPANPNLPHFLEAYKKLNGQDLTGNPRKAYDIFFHATIAASKALLLPAGTSKTILETYKTAVQKAVGTNNQYITGEAAQRAFSKALNFDPKFTNWLQNYVRLHKGKI